MRSRVLLASLVLVALPSLAPASETAPPAEPRAPNAEEYRALASEMESELRGMLRAWFPRTLDRERGGFLEQFREDWSPGRETGKFLVYQARLTWVAAAVAEWAPDLREEHLEYARHGVRFLVGAMRDRERGGVYFRLGLDGKPEAGPAAEKHAYGLAFAIYAGAAAYRATRDPAALSIAQEAFRWLDERAHDAANGGYFESLGLEGRVRPADGRAFDGIGTLLGFKSMNSHIHLLEAFAELYRVWPDAQLRERLEEVLALVRDRIAVEPGCLNLFFTPDWRAVPAHDSFGHDIETAFLLAEASEALGSPDDERTWRVARSLVDHALEWGFDAERGGFYEKGEAFAPAHDTTKVWWTQAEGLNALLLLHERCGRETARYFEAFRKQWRFVREHVIDRRHGGWFPHVSREGIPISREKASPWKAAYHDGRALLRCVERLRRLGG